MGSLGFKLLNQHGGPRNRHEWKQVYDGTQMLHGTAIIVANLGVVDLNSMGAPYLPVPDRSHGRTVVFTRPQTGVVQFLFFGSKRQRDHWVP